MVRIKICGVTAVEDAVAAAELGADAVGLNFYPLSPRSIDSDIANAIVRALPPFVTVVGVFVEEPLASIAQHFATIPGLELAQWHGDEPLAEFLPDRKWVAAFPVRDESSLARIEASLDKYEAAGTMPSAILVDAHVKGQYGGTGRRAPWQLLADYQPRVPLILAGGLTPDNVAEAIRSVRPAAVDVASGVESAPGRKDHDKMRLFVERAREAD